PPRESPLFPYTTLFRSGKGASQAEQRAQERVLCGGVGLRANAHEKRQEGGRAQSPAERLHQRGDVHQRRIWRERRSRSIDQIGRSEEHTSELQSRGHLV